MAPRKQPVGVAKMSSQRSRTTVATGATNATTSNTADELAAGIRTRLILSDTKGKGKVTISHSAADPAPLPAPRQRSKRIASKEAVIDDLTAAMTQKLKLTRMEEEVVKTDEERCAEAMRTVNKASKALSSIAEQGWKTSSRVQTPPLHKAKRTSPSTSDNTQAQIILLYDSVRQGLATLRELRTDDIDVERAACSAAGKLISLEEVGPHCILRAGGN